MRNFTISILIGILSFTALSQDITGKWNGAIKIQGIQLRLVFNIIESDLGYISTMDSPDQGAYGIPVTTTTFQDSKLTIEIANAQIQYQGLLDNKMIIVGTFKQGVQSFPLNLTKDIIEKEKFARPQEPLEPFSYYSEVLTFNNKKAGISLAGTLTLPKKEGIFPVVILISGSGPQNRNEELLGHKPFLVLADYLTKNGIAVLRFDDRGVDQSEGNFKTATTYDFSTDVEAGINYLKTRKEIDKSKIGLIGHSEGGIIAPMVASRSKDVAFIVLLAGTGMPGGELLLLQQKLIGKVSGVSDEELNKAYLINKGAFDIVTASSNMEKLKTDLSDYFLKVLKEDPDLKINNEMNDEDFITLHVDQIVNPWMYYFIKYDPTTALVKVKCPVLAINGEKDLQVPPNENLEPIKKALIKGGNKNVTTLELPDLNHLFQECTSGLPEEYSKIEQTFSPLAMNEILNWIQLQTK